MLGGLLGLPVLVFLVTSVHSLASKRAAEAKILLVSSTVYGVTSAAVLVASTVALSVSTVAL